MLFYTTILNIIFGLLLTLCVLFPSILNGIIDIQTDGNFAEGNRFFFIVFGIFLTGKNVLIFFFKNKIELKIFFSINLIFDTLLIFCFLHLINIHIPSRYYIFGKSSPTLSIETINEIISGTILLFFLNQILFITLLIVNYFKKRNANSFSEILDD